MRAAAFIVSQVGPLVTFQDGGRPRMMRFGVSASGAMDQGSFSIANTALGNACDAPAIEISVGGLALECVEGSVTVAIAGGGFKVAIDQTSLGSWSIATIRAGSCLTVKPGPWGSWTYLAFAGQLQADSWLGSVSTHAPSGLGGGQLATEQHLVINDAEVRDERVGKIPYPVFVGPRKSLRVVLGPQDRLFESEAIAALLSEKFALTDAYDRMGVRMSGPLLYPNMTLDMPTEGVVRGSIQVAGDGVATALLADHQTTGGYPRIATIISNDMDGFVQLRGHDEVVFTKITPETAVQIARARCRAYEQFLTNLQIHAHSRRLGH